MTKRSKIPTSRLLTWHRELLDITAGRNEIHARELARKWNCSVNAAKLRLFYMRHCNLPTPRIKETSGAPRKKWTKRKAGMRKRLPNPRGISQDACGDPSLPKCPDCERAGRKSVYGKPVHLTTDGKFRWCEVCGYDPDYRTAVNNPVEMRFRIMEITR